MAIHGWTLFSLGLKGQQVTKKVALHSVPIWGSHLVAVLVGCLSTIGCLLHPARHIAENKLVLELHLLVCMQVRDVSDAEDPLKDFIDALGTRARGIGEKLKSTWDAVGNTIGQAIIRFGFAIHSLL